MGHGRRKDGDEPWAIGAGRGAGPGAGRGAGPGDRRRSGAQGAWG
jgi:hypothetical protein